MLGYEFRLLCRCQVCTGAASRAMRLLTLLAAGFFFRAYQEISDDSIPTFAKTVGTLITSLRPDRALSSQPLDPPRELLKNQ